MMEAGYANSSNRAGFGQERVSDSRHRRFGTSRSARKVMRLIRKRRCLMLEPGPTGEVRFVNRLFPSGRLINPNGRGNLLGGVANAPESDDLGEMSMSVFRVATTLLAGLFLCQLLTTRALGQTGNCVAARASYALGRKFTAKVAEEARVAAKADLVRALRRDRVYTMEFRSNRLTLALDRRGIIVSVGCS
jgi:hypothetical protein